MQDFHTPKMHIVSWKPEGHYQYSKMFRWEPEGRYRWTMSMVIVPFWFSMEHLWIVIAPFWLSTDDIYRERYGNVQNDSMAGNSYKCHRVVVCFFNIFYLPNKPNSPLHLITMQLHVHPQNVLTNQFTLYHALWAECSKNLHNVGNLFLYGDNMDSISEFGISQWAKNHGIFQRSFGINTE